MSESKSEEPAEITRLIEMAKRRSTGIAKLEEREEQGTQSSDAERWSMPGAGIPDFNSKKRKGMAYISLRESRLLSASRSREAGGTS